MNCWHCERPSSGNCRFCGRALCRDHARTRPYIISAYPGENGPLALVVEDVLHCGVCRPREEPVALKGLR